MTKYIVRRVLISVPVLVVITILTYAFINLAPGDPISAMSDGLDITAGGGMQGVATEAQRKRFGLDKPWPVRYVLWLRELATGNLGRSYATGEPVLTEIGRRMVPTLELTSIALVLSTVFGTLFGVIAALKQYSAYDYGLSIAALFGVSIPGFFFALLCLYLFVAVLGWFPSHGMNTYGQPFSIWDNLYHLILPASVLAIESMAGMTRYGRTAMLEVMKSDYVTTARSKGLTEYVVIGRHAFSNALLPLITISTLRLPFLFGGAILIEFMFAWPGMGQLSITAVRNRDYTMLMGLALFIAVIVLVANLLADILYAYADPRIRVS